MVRVPLLFVPLALAAGGGGTPIRTAAAAQEPSAMSTLGVWRGLEWGMRGMVLERGTEAMRVERRAATTSSSKKASSSSKTLPSTSAKSSSSAKS